MKKDEENIIEKFYQAFEHLDAERMVETYHDDVTFEDPAFGILRGEKAKNMWRMLCSSQQGKDFKVKTTHIEYTPERGTARWEAYYTFGKKQRKVHNVINAKFEFKDGKIINHLDSFNLYKWSSQSMGITGFLLGWTAFFKKSLNKKTHMRLSQFEKNKKINNAMESITTNWTRKELKAYILLYCAHADFIETQEEVNYIKTKVSDAEYKKIHKEFEDDSDYESIQKIEYTVEKYNYSKEEIHTLFERIKELFYLDGEYSAAEQSIFIGLKHLLGKN